MDLFFSMLRHPRFEESRLELAKSQAEQQMARRNDSTGAIEGREWVRLMRGDAIIFPRDLLTTRVAQRDHSGGSCRILRGVLSSGCVHRGRVGGCHAGRNHSEAGGADGGLARRCRPGG